MAYSEYKDSSLQRVLHFGIEEIAILSNSYLDNEFAKDYLNKFQELLIFMDKVFFPCFSKGGPDGPLARVSSIKNVALLGFKALNYDRMSQELQSNEKPEKLRYDIAKLRIAILEQLSQQEKEKFSSLAPFLDPKKLHLPDIALDIVGRIFEDKDKENYQKFICDQLTYHHQIILDYEKNHPVQRILPQSSKEDDSKKDADEQINLLDDDSFDHLSTESESENLPVTRIHTEGNNREKNVELTTNVLALQKEREQKTPFENEIAGLIKELEEIRVACNSSDKIINSVNRNFEKMADDLEHAPKNDDEWLAFFDALQKVILDDSAKAKHHIPFEALDDSHLLIPKMAGYKPGFEFLLTLLKVSNDIREAWRNYRSTQENRFKTAHPKNDYIKQRALLIKAIQSQKQETETKKSEIAKQEELQKSHSKKLESLKEKIGALEKIQQSILFLELETRISEMETECEADLALLLQARDSGLKEAINATKRRKSQTTKAIREASIIMMQEKRAAFEVALSESKKEQMDLALKNFPEIVTLTNLKADYPKQYQFLDQSTKAALSSYTLSSYMLTTDPELALLAIINEKKLVEQDSKEDQFLDSIYWKVQFCSARIAYPKENDKNPLLTVKNKITRTSQEYMTALNLIDERLTHMKKHGLKLQRQKEPCAEKVILLERQLRMVFERFILQHGNGNTPSLETLQAFKKTFSEKLRTLYNDSSMSNHRAKWKQWVANVALALTSFVSYVIRTRHTTHKVGRAAEGHDTFFFHKTDRQHQIDSVEDALNKLDDVKRPTK